MAVSSQDSVSLQSSVLHRCRLLRRRYSFSLLFSLEFALQCYILVLSLFGDAGNRVLIDRSLCELFHLHLNAVAVLVRDPDRINSLSVCDHHLGRFPLYALQKLEFNLPVTGIIIDILELNSAGARRDPDLSRDACVLFIGSLLYSRDRKGNLLPLRDIGDTEFQIVIVLPDECGFELIALFVL